MGFERIGIDDDFIRLGGDSISIMKLIQQCHNLPVSSAIIYNCRTPREIAAMMKRQDVGKTWQDVKEVPLSQTQLGIWFECEKRQGEAVYNNPFLYRLGLGLDLNRLSQAVEETVKAHPALLASIAVKDDGTPVMVRDGHSEDGPACTISELTEKELERLKRNLIQPFDLRKDRLFRICIFKTEKAQYLFMDFHHIIFDGTSMHIFLEDVDRAYRGETVDNEPFSGFDVDIQEQADRDTDLYVKAKDWYIDNFGTVEEMSLPIADRNIGGTSFGLNDIVMNVKSEDIIAFAASNNVTPNIVATAAFGKLLCAYSYTQDASFATIYNGRKDMRTARTISMLVKTLPVHSVMSDGMTVREYLNNSKMQLMGAMANDIFSFAELASLINYSSDVLFVWQGDMARMPAISDAILIKEQLDFNATGEKLCIQVNNLPDGLHLSAQYHSNLYSEEFITRLMKAYETVLKEMMVRTCIDDVRLVDEEGEKHLDSFNKKEDTVGNFGSETIVSMFCAAAKKYPDNVAVVFKDRKLTYRELDAMTDKLAAVILQRCARNSNEPVVSVLIHRNEWMVVASLAVLKSGCAYQPLDPSYPQQRLNFMIKDANAGLLVCDEDLRGIVDEYEGHVLLTQEMEAILSSSNNSCLFDGKAPSPESLFILLYTSGSTGVPKGVMLEHRNLVAFCHWYHRYYSLEPESRVAAYASYGFDACMMDMYPALTRGGQVHIIPEELRLDLDAINGYFEANGITHSFITTQVGVQFAINMDNHSLQHLSVGGEKLISFNPREGYTFHNGYGPTECTIFSTTFPVLHNEPNIPIGKPLDALDCYVVDRKLNRLPVGAAGELIICGNQVGRGYLNRPDLTEKVFFEMRGRRAYHSGDIVRYRTDGNIEFIGRKDGQVKIRGYRIELKEVEAVIREFEGIKDVTVQAFDNPEGGKFIAAYIVGTEKIDIKRLNSYVSEHKPAYMVPSVTMQIDYIPLNVNQKVDKRSLPQPEVRNEKDFVAPVGNKETLVAEAFAKVLGINEPISAQDSFTDLGGDSIKAIRLLTALRQKGMTILVPQILQLATVRKIAEAASGGASSTEFSQAEFCGFVEETPLLRYFTDLNFPKPEYFNQAFLFKSSGIIDTALLGKALEAVIRHHDMMRTVLKDSRLYVRSISEGELVTLEEYGDVDITEVSTRIQASFDLGKGPWVKCAVFRKPEADYLMIAVHHLAVDGISWRIIGEDLNCAYAQMESGKDINLQPKTASYDQYAKALSKYRGSRTLLREKKYWESVVSAKRQCLLSWPKEKGFISERKEIFLDEKYTSLFLRKAHKAYNTQPDDLFLAALGLTFHMITGDKRLSVLFESHGREDFDPDLEIDRTVGWFTAIFPVVFDDLCKDVRTLVRNAKQTRRRIPDKGFGYPQLMGISTKDCPLVTFNYLGNLTENSEDAKFVISQNYSLGNMIAPENKYGTDITVNGIQDGDKIRFIIDYNICRFSEAQADEFCGLFMESLSNVIDHTCSVSSPEKTPSLFGETEWSDSEFREILSDFAFRRESILAIRHLSKQQIRQIQNYVVNPDSMLDVRCYAIELETVIEKGIFEESLEKLYLKHECMRSSIGMYGVSVPRLIVTDRKPIPLYYDFSEKDNPEIEFFRLKNVISSLAFNIQAEPLLRIVPVKLSDSRMFIIFCCQTILVNMSITRSVAADLFRLFEKAMKDSGDIGEWAQLLEEADEIEEESKPLNVSESRHIGKALKNDIEKQIALIFSELLDIDSDGIYADSSFVELGGSEFEIMALSSGIGTSFGISLPPVRIKENPTVEGIAKLLEKGQEVEVKEDIHSYSCHSDKRKLFFVHTANTGSEAYFNLAREIADECSFYAFEQYNLNHPSDQIEGGIPEIASKYISLLREIQPEGPYLLGGWCYGGTVAYEMAHQLTERGEKVDCVILLDSHIIEDEKMRKDVLEVSKVQNKDYLTNSELFSGMRSKGLLEQLIKNSIKTTRNWLYYVPPFYSGKVVYFKATVKDSSLLGTVDDMYNHVMAKLAAGFENCIADGKLSIFSVEEMHDSMMSGKSLSVVVPQIIKILRNDPD